MKRQVITNKSNFLSSANLYFLKNKCRKQVGLPTIDLSDARARVEQCKNTIEPIYRRQNICRPQAGCGACGNSFSALARVAKLCRLLRKLKTLCCGIYFSK